LCPDCTATRSLTFGKSVSICGICGSLAPAITLPRAELTPFAGAMLGAWRFPLTPSGLGTMAIVGAVLAVLPNVAIVALIARGIFWSYVFSIIRTSGNGDARIGVPDFRDFYEDIISPALRGALALALIWVPAVLWVGSGLAAGGGVTDAFASPVPWLLLILGVVYGPIAALGAATDVPVLAMCNPVRLFVGIKRLGSDYFLAVAGLVVLAMVGALIAGASTMLVRLPVPLLPSVLAEAAGLYAPFVMARVLGLLLYTRGYALDWGDESTYLVPVLGAEQPRGQPPSTAPGATPPIPPTMTAPSPRPAAPDVPATPSSLSPAEQLTAGRAAFARKDMVAAVRALKAAAFSSDAAVAKVALLDLAGAYTTGTGDLDSAERIYREIIKRHPESEQAQAARAALQRLG
jgi:hypothetical protein